MDKALRLIGLALRGRNLAVGEEPVSIAAHSGNVRAVFVASDASGRTKRRGEALAQAAGVDCVALGYGKAALGHAVGRAACAILAVTDSGLSRAIKQALAGQDVREGPRARQGDPQ